MKIYEKLMQNIQQKITNYAENAGIANEYKKCKICRIMQNNAKTAENAMNAMKAKKNVGKFITKHIGQFLAIQRIRCG